MTHEVSPGVYLSMQALPTGGYELKRVRFAKQMFSGEDAEQWWAANRSAVYANYNIVSLQQPGQAFPDQRHLQQQEIAVGAPDQQQQQQQEHPDVSSGQMSAAAAAVSGDGRSPSPPIVSVGNPHPLGQPAAVTASRASSLTHVRTKR